jgi:hypothetical protein
MYEYLLTMIAIINKFASLDYGEFVNDVFKDRHIEFALISINETIKQFHQLGIKKFTFQTYYGPPAINVFKMPVAIQALAAKNLNNVIKLHYDNIHPEDRDFYPLANLELIQAKLNDAQTCNFSKKEFYNQIAWYDQWSNTKFKDLWPHVIDLVELHLE